MFEGKKSERKYGPKMEIKKFLDLIKKIAEEYLTKKDSRPKKQKAKNRGDQNSL